MLLDNTEVDKHLELHKIHFLLVYCSSHVQMFYFFVKMRGFPHTSNIYCATKEKNKDIKNDETSHEYHELIECINASMQFYREIKRFFIITIALH